MLAGPSPEPRGTGLPLSLFFSPRATSYSPGRSRGRDGRGGGAGEAFKSSSGLLKTNCSGLLHGLPPLLGTTHQVVPDRALFAALVRGQTHILAREHCASLEVPEERGAGTDP